MRDSQLSGVQFLGVCVFFYNIPADYSARFQETRLPYFGREMTGRFQSYQFGTTQVGLSIASQIVSNHVSCDMVILLFHSRKLRGVLAGKCTTLVALHVLQHATTFPQNVPKSAMQV